jgi:hypothetical protein
MEAQLSPTHRLKALHSRFALILPGMTQVTRAEIESMVSSGPRNPFFNSIIADTGGVD